MKFCKFASTCHDVSKEDQTGLNFRSDFNDTRNLIIKLREVFLRSLFAFYTQCFRVNYINCKINDLKTKWKYSGKINDFKMRDGTSLFILLNLSQEGEIYTLWKRVFLCDYKVEIIFSSNPINTRDIVKYVFKSICSRACRALLEVSGSTCIAV